MELISFGHAVRCGHWLAGIYGVSSTAGDASCASSVTRSYITDTVTENNLSERFSLFHAVTTDWNWTSKCCLSRTVHFSVRSQGTSLSVTTIGYELSLTIMIGGWGWGSWPVWSYAVKNDDERFSGLFERRGFYPTMPEPVKRVRDWLSGPGRDWNHTRWVRNSAVWLTVNCRKRLKKLKKKN